MYRDFRRGGGVTFLHEKFTQLSKCMIVKIWMQTLSNFMKNKTFRTATSNETAIIQKIVISKSCILNDLYRQSQTSKNQKCINFIYKFLEVTWTALFYNVFSQVLFLGIMSNLPRKSHTSNFCSWGLQPPSPLSSYTYDLENAGSYPICWFILFS